MTDDEWDKFEELNELAGEILSLLDTQQAYFKTRSYVLLMHCKEREKNMRERCLNILERRP